MVPDEKVLSGPVARAKNGDKRAWDMLVERYAPVVWSICRRHKLSRQATDDVGQSVWLRLVERIDTLREPPALTRWLADTTHNECSRVLSVTHQRSASSSAPETASNDRPAPAEHWLFTAERDAAMGEASAALSPRCQHLLSMPQILRCLALRSVRLQASRWTISARSAANASTAPSVPRAGRADRR